MPVVPVPDAAPFGDVSDVRSRTVMLVGARDDEIAARLAAQIMALDAAADGAPIELHVATRSAELDAALLLADVVGATAAPVVAVARGIVGGPALAPFAAASERRGSRHVLFAFVEPELGAGSATVRDVPAVADAFARQVAVLHGWVANATGRPVSEVADDFRRGHSMDAAEALHYGLLDAVDDAPHGR